MSGNLNNLSNGCLNSPASMTNGGGGVDAFIHPPPAQSDAVSPEMLFKISKKIAQLTKVIYSLNTRNDDLELELSQVKESYQECLRRSRSNPTLSTQEEEDAPTSTVKGHHHKRRSKTPEAADSDTRKELKKARHIMKHLESKMKAMEEERRRELVEQAKATGVAPTTGDNRAMLEEQVG